MITFLNYNSMTMLLLGEAFFFFFGGSLKDHCNSSGAAFHDTPHGKLLGKLHLVIYDSSQVQVANLWF